MIFAPLYLASDDASLGAAPSICTPFYGDKIGGSTLDGADAKKMSYNDLPHYDGRDFYQKSFRCPSQANRGHSL
jgi:hypothetical protein